MNTVFPSIEGIRARLQLLKDGEIYKVAHDSGVPASTLWKIRCGATPNPGIETVRKFFHLLPALAQQPVEPVADICITEPTPAANDPQAPQPAEQGAANA